jgi:hypothetical protein
VRQKKGPETQYIAFPGFFFAFFKNRCFAWGLLWGLLVIFGAYFASKSAL